MGRSDSLATLLNATPLDERERLTVPVQGAQITARVSGPEHGPGIMLVHGGGASAVWWDAVVANLSPAQRIVAVDLSGHGDSDWRDDYCAEQWIEELYAVTAAADFSRPPVIVGHSLGGALAVSAALRSPQRFGGVVTVDGHPGGPPAGGLRPRPTETQRHRVFPDRAQGAERFIASKPSWPGWFARHVAERSLVETGEGWRFRRDLLTLAISTPVLASHAAPAMTGDWPFGFLHGAQSPFLERDQRYVARSGGVVGELVVGAGHEVLAEQPAACVRGLERVTRGLIRPLQ